MDTVGTEVMDTAGEWDLFGDLKSWTPTGFDGGIW